MAKYRKKQTVDFATRHAANFHLRQFFQQGDGQQPREAGGVRNAHGGPWARWRPVDAYPPRRHASGRVGLLEQDPRRYHPTPPKTTPPTTDNGFSSRPHRMRLLIISSKCISLAA